MLTYQGEHGSKVGKVDPLAWRHNMDARLDEMFINETTDVLFNLLNNIDRQHFTGVWLDICSGHGIAAVNSLWPRGVDLLHIDKTVAPHTQFIRSRIGYYLANTERNSGWINGCRYSDENYLEGDVIDLASNQNQILARVGRSSIAGALLLHPIWHEEVNSASIKIAADLLKPGSPFVIITDKSDAGHIQLLKSLVGDKFEKMEEYPQAGPASHGFIAYR